jgi:hypothetical protein
MTRPIRFACGRCNWRWARCRAGISAEVNGEHLAPENAAYTLGVNVIIVTISHAPAPDEGLLEQIGSSYKDPGFWVGVADSACRATPSAAACR